MDEENPDDGGGAMVPFDVDLPPLLMDLIHHEARRRDVTAQQLVRQIIGEWAIGTIRGRSR